MDRLRIRRLLRDAGVPRVEGEDAVALAGEHPRERKPVAEPRPRLVRHHDPFAPGPEDDAGKANAVPGPKADRMPAKGRRDARVDGRLRRCHYRAAEKRRSNGDENGEPRHRREDRSGRQADGEGRLDRLELTTRASTTAGGCVGNREVPQRDQAAEPVDRRYR